MNKSNTIGGIIGTILSGIGTSLSLDELQTIISIIFTCIGGLIVIISSVVIPFVKWLKKAKEDGVITKEELEEGKKIIEDGSQIIKNHFEDKK